MSSQKTASPHNEIIEITNDKVEEGKKLELGKWQTGQHPQQKQEIICKRIRALRHERKKQHNIFSVDAKINKSVLIDLLQQSNHQIKQAKKKKKKNKLGKKKKQKRIRNRSSKSIANNTIKQEKDSFMNEELIQQQYPQKKQKYHSENIENKMTPNLHNLNKEVQLIAEIQSSIGTQSNSQYDEQQNDESYQKTRMKDSKLNKSKQKTKMINKNRSLRLRKRQNYSYMFDYENKSDSKKNNKLKNDPKNGNKNKINLQALAKDFDKSVYIENLLVYSVLQSGMCGPYKYYLVRLKNKQNIYVRQKDMLHYFPRKLNEFYQRILNKVAKSTRQLHFAL